MLASLLLTQVPLTTEETINKAGANQEPHPSATSLLSGEKLL